MEDNGLLNGKGAADNGGAPADPKNKGRFLRLIKTLASFIGSSVICWLVDYFLLLGLNALFTLYAEKHGGTFLIPDLDTKLAAIVIARIASSTLNYLLNRRVVFRDGSRISVVLYFTTVAVLLGLNYALLALFTLWGIPLWLAQILAQAMIYPVSFLLQKKVVFRNWKNEKRS